MFTPAITKVLKYLRENPTKKTKEQISSIIGEKQEYVNRALDKLVAIKVVAEEEGFYWYTFTLYSEDFSTKMLEVYDRVGKRPVKELLIRGLICQIPSHYLFHAETLLEILEKEGLDRKELEEFLEREIEDGYLKKIRIIYLGMGHLSLPLYIPSYYITHLRIVEWERYEGLKHKGAESYEEDYLMGQYPPELAEPAKEYIERERKDVKDKLKKEIFSTWSRLDRFI